LAESFGRGAMTNHWTDLANVDCFLVIGSNPAENHPIAFHWITKALENRGAKLLVVDPRFSRTAAKAHMYAPLRSGTDIAFVNGMINRILENNLYNEAYVKAYTNASFLVNANFRAYMEANAPFPGTFPGLNTTTNPAAYNKADWGYQADSNTGIPLRDPTLQNPDCVFQIMKKFFSRYTPEIVEKITGCPQATLIQVTDEYAQTAAPDKAGTIMYAMGATQHTYGTQNIRAYGILQMLLANIGIAGGGINAMRGESNVQGATDQGILYHYLPAYVPSPTSTQQSLGVRAIGTDLVSTGAGSKVVTSVDTPATLTSPAIPASDFIARGVAVNDILVFYAGANTGCGIKITSVDSAHQLTLQYAVNKAATAQSFMIIRSGSYLAANIPVTNDPQSINWWHNRSKYLVSMLKAWWPTKMNNITPTDPTGADIAYSYLPKRSGDYSYMSLWEAVHTGTIKGLVAMGMNPAVGSPNSNRTRAALDKLDWMVIMELWETETAQFWKRPGVDPATINTAVYFLPAAAMVEKEGSVSNSGRWCQWRHKAVEPPGNAKDDLWMLNELYKRIKSRYVASGGAFPDPILNLNWNYEGTEGIPEAAKVSRELNGYYTADNTVVQNFTKLTYTGSTACGNWVFSGCFASADKVEKNMMDRRDNVDTSGIWLYSNWAWCWPLNRRIIYNRASVDPQTGLPWDPSRKVVQWSTADAKWLGPDIVDGGAANSGIVTESSYRLPFIMNNDGMGRVYGSFSLADGPFPEHYEPMESPVENLLHPAQPTSPCVYKYPGDVNMQLNVFGDRNTYPIVGTTYRVAEHWQAGAMTRNLSWLCEAQPSMFVEMSLELAAEKGIANGDKVRVSTIRGSIDAYALVTGRLKPFQMNGQTVHQIGMPWHYGYAGIAKGDSANILTPSVGDVNTRIPEYKAFLCNVEKI